MNPLPLPHLKRPRLMILSPQERENMQVKYLQPFTVKQASLPKVVHKPSDADTSSNLLFDSFSYQHNRSFINEYSELEKSLFPNKGSSTRNRMTHDPKNVINKLSTNQQLPTTILKTIKPSNSFSVDNNSGGQGEKEIVKKYQSPIPNEIKQYLDIKIDSTNK